MTGTGGSAAARTAGDGGTAAGGSPAGGAGTPGGAKAAGGADQAEQQAFEYAVLRVVPRVDRGEVMNAGILLYCRPLRYLGARVALDTGLLLAMDPAADVSGVQRTLDAIADLCIAPAGAGTSAGVTGGARGRGSAEEPGSGEEPRRAASPGKPGEEPGEPGKAGPAPGPEPSPAGQVDIGRRFRWLTAPRSTVVQAGPVHTGLTRDPDAEIDRLLRALVLRPR